MSDFFRDKYSEIILNKQKSLGDYQSAISNLLTAFQKKLNQKEDVDLISKEFTMNMHNTLNELEKLQFKKIGLKVDQPVYFEDNFSDVHISQQYSTLKEIQNELLQSLEPQQTSSAPEASKEDLSDSSQSLKPEQKPADPVDLKDIENDLSKSNEVDQQSETLSKKQTKNKKKTLKNKQSLKVTIKNDASPPPPWIPR